MVILKFAKVITSDDGISSMYCEVRGYVLEFCVIIDI